MISFLILIIIFIHLFKRPEEVINEFINGTRKKHINVIQYFAISLTLAGFQIFLMNTFFKDAFNVDAIYGDAFANLESQKDNPFSPANFDYAQINNYQSIIYILTVPFSAIATWIAYYIIGDRRFNFTEHVVLNLYYSAQTIIVTAVFTILLLCFGVSYVLISSIVALLTFVYFFYVLKRVFKTPFWDTVARFILVMLALGIMFIGIIIIAVIVVLVKTKLNS